MFPGSHPIEINGPVSSKDPQLTQSVRLREKFSLRMRSFPKFSGLTEIRPHDRMPGNLREPIPFRRIGIPLGEKRAFSLMDFEVETLRPTITGPPTVEKEFSRWFLRLAKSS
ncbi:MAG: hypothetical protein ABS79_07220 [Planctomycetes bacterium SCN 63-9]|nr:MAG: hypothetical protein ABS79_07220 [Planctomycetes bacterium SCN 63-9]